jgi:hypothetical protein
MINIIFSRIRNSFSKTINLQKIGELNLIKYKKLIDDAEIICIDTGTRWIHLRGSEERMEEFYLTSDPFSIRTLRVVIADRDYEEAMEFAENF